MDKRQRWVGAVAVFGVLALAASLPLAAEQERLDDQDEAGVPQHPAAQLAEDPARDRARAGFPAQQDFFDPDAEERARPGDLIQREPAPVPRIVERPDPEDELAARPFEPDAQKLEVLSRYIDRPVMDTQGERMGHLEKLVMDPQDRSLHAVIRTDEDPAERQMLLAAERLSPEDDALRADLTDTEELDELAEYRPEQYQQLAPHPDA